MNIYIDAQWYNLLIEGDTEILNNEYRFQK